MEKTLLGICASPRKLGNCELFIKDVFKNLGRGWELKIARLAELDIRTCKGCYQCLFGEMRCPQQDDLPDLLENLAEADAYVVAAPVYAAPVYAGPVYAAPVYAPGYVWAPGYWSVGATGRAWVPGCWHYRGGYVCGHGGWDHGGGWHH